MQLAMLEKIHVRHETTKKVTRNRTKKNALHRIMESNKNDTLRDARMKTVANASIFVFQVDIVEEF